MLLSACSDGGPASAGHAALNLSGRPAGGDFVLQSAAGPLDTKSLRGRVLLLFFGYTSCPDICPGALAAGAQALNALDARERERVRLVFVSVDPERDTPERLKEYVSYFHPQMIGVTGTPAEIAAVATAYRAFYVRHPTAADGSYAVDHSTSTYVIGPDGRLAEVVVAGMSAQQVADVVRRLL
ncbi:MAG: SCO family protein [Betaproteobacteria bacterium]|nr:SCO family protein [Betaproteobacteria bacterium]